MDPGRRRARPIGPQAVDLGGAERLDGAAPLARRHFRPPPGPVTRSVRGSTSSSCDGRRTLSYDAGELERVRTTSVGGSSRLRPRRGNEATTGRWRCWHPRRSTVDLRIDTGSPTIGSAAAPPGRPQGPRPDLDRGLNRLFLDRPSRRRACARRGRRGRRARPRRASDDAEQGERDPGDEQRGGVEHAARQGAASARRPPPPPPAHRRRLSSAGRTDTHSALTTPAPRRWRRRSRRGRPPGDSGASTSRWESTGSASACTSSGKAWSRPCIIACALAARSSSRPARGLAPRSTRGSSRVRHSSSHDVVAQRLRGAHARGGILGGKHLGRGGDRRERQHAVTGLVVGEHPRLVTAATGSRARSGP